MQVNESLFGEYQGEKITLYELNNENGMEMKLMNYGATITSILIPTAEGKIELVCGFDTFAEYFSEAYKNNSPYFGCTVGRYCSQIKDAKFALEGKVYQLAKNAGENNLHGGVKGFDKKVWKAEPISGKDIVGVKFKMSSPDGEEGFPGNVEAQVTISLNNANEIRCDYKATTDSTTPLSMTNHTYFNLSGFAENVENHLVKVYTKSLLEIDESGAATGSIIDVSGLVEDLSSPKRIGDVQDALDEGFEHFWVFGPADNLLKQVAEVSLNEVLLEVFSTEPCMVLYTGKYTSDNLKRESGLQYGKYHGLCLGTHRYQNGPNIQGSPGTFTTPAKPYESTTIYKLNCD